MLIMNCMHASVQGFDALRVLTEQARLQECSSSATTEGVRIDISAGFVAVR